MSEEGACYTSFSNTFQLSEQRIVNAYMQEPCIGGSD